MSALICNPLFHHLPFHFLIVFGVAHLACAHLEAIRLGVAIAHITAASE